jgi:CheY-like chemotaxis protein
LSVPSHLRILLADDMDVTRSVTADFLRAAGHAVTEVANGEAATREAREHDFDVILTDMRMPVVDGLEATRRIRMLPGYRGRTPVVLVTADLAARDRGLSGQAGVDLCLLKPFTRAELLDTVQEAARLTPVPDPTDCPILDATILGQLRESLGDRATEEHLRAASRRLDALSALLRTPDAARSPDVEDAVHDLAGVAGIMGMTALSVCLMRFHTASDRAGPVASLREMLTETALALRKQMPMANIA